MFISNICLISQIFPEEFRRPLSGPGGYSPASRHHQTMLLSLPSARERKRDLGIFPLHSFLISVCVSAGILLLSNTLEFGRVSARLLLPTATPVSHSGLGHKHAGHSHTVPSHSVPSHTVPNLCPLPVHTPPPTATLLDAKVHQFLAFM